MPRVLRPAKPDNLVCLENTTRYLKEARFWCHHADSPKLMEAINHAIASAGGARRHMIRRLSKMEA